MQSGESVGGRFTVERSVGRGGMGEIFFARDQKTGGVAALKLLTERGEAALTRFTQEVYLLSALDHPAIVRYLDHGQTATGKPYLAMEWLEGEDLSEKLSRGRLDIYESATLCAQVASVLSVVHQKGVIHRDIKPSNLFLVEEAEALQTKDWGQVFDVAETRDWGDVVQRTEEDQKTEGDGKNSLSSLLRPLSSVVKLLDFGIARPDWSTPEPGKQESPVGTPGYMAPEQARGERSVDGRADLFSLGCVLYECLTGVPPFHAYHVVAVLAKILFEEAPRVGVLRPEVPAALEELVAAMLSKDPAARPTDAQEVAQKLFDIVQTGPEEVFTRPQAALTGGEQRFLCVVLAGGVFPPSRMTTQDLTFGARTVIGPAHTVSTGGSSGPLATVLLPSEAAAQRLLALREAAAQYGGRLEPLADGAVAVLLLSDGAATDQAERAAHCALALRALLPEAPMALAVGRGEIARLQVGEVIDRAAKLLKVEGTREAPSNPKAPLPIRVDEGAVGLLDMRFEIGGDSLGLVLRAVRSRFAAARTLLGRPTPCVGRDAELARLFSLLSQCETTPRAQAVVVIAPAGVGKSRLRYEFMRQLEGRGESLTLLLSRGDPLGAGSPFGMLSQALRRAARHHDGEPLPLLQSKLRARLSRHIRKSEDILRISQFLGELVGVPFSDDSSAALKAARQDPRLMGDQMLRAFLDWLAAEVAIRPLLFILEDLHWGDLPSVRFLDAALSTLRHLPLFVLALARPELHKLFPALWQGQVLEEIRLVGLAPEASAELVRTVLGQKTSEEVVSGLVERAAGNAFYLEELCRAVAEGKGEALPDTVLGMVQARLASLPAGARKALRAASVFGQSFWRGAISSLLGTDAELTEGLMELLDREMISRRAEPRFPKEEEFNFRHSLLQEAAYSTLLEEDRALGHRLAGEWLQGVGERDAAVLAEHFERGNTPSRAVGHYLHAAEQALEGNDLEAVLSLTERAISCGASGETLGQLRLLQAISYNWRGQFSETLGRALGALQELPRCSASWYNAAGEAAISSAKVGDHQRLILLGEELYSLRTKPASAPQLIAAARTAAQLYLAGRNQPAEDLRGWIEASVAGGVLIEPAVLARINEMRSFQLAIVRGDISATIQRNEEAAASFESIGDLRNAAANYSDTGFAHLEVGSYARSEEVTRRVLALATEMGAHRLIAVAQAVLGAALSRQGRFAEARPLEMEAAEALLSQGDKRMGGFSRHHLARLLMRTNDLAGAEREALLAVNLLTGIEPFLAPALATLAQVQLAMGRTSEALETSQNAKRILDKLGQLGLNDSLVRLVYAEVLYEAGYINEARGAITEARERLLSRAAKLSDKRVQRNFLEEVWENARTLALAEAWVG